MKRMNKVIFIVLMMMTPTLQVAAYQSESEQFKQQLLKEIQQEIKDLPPVEIRKIINDVEKSINEDIVRYEVTPKDELLTKDELYVRQHRNEVSSQRLVTLQKQSHKPKEQILLEELNPKLKMMSDDSYHYNNVTKEIEFNEHAVASFGKQKQPVYAWDYLAKGDILINFDNGSSSGLFKWGHAGMLYSKGRDTKSSWTIEALGGNEPVKLKNYDTSWHQNKENRITYNYVPAIYDTPKPSRAANEAKKYEGRPYGIWHPLAQSNEIYCTELVYIAYKSQGIDLGNGIKKGSRQILLPQKMYCDSDLMYYYRQKVGGGMC
jgi:hypothetical protein